MPSAKRLPAHQDLVNKKLSRKHWGKVIIEAERRGAFTEQEIYAAGNWCTCACGKQSPLIPRDKDATFGDRPQDQKLAEMGEAFWRSVKNQEFYASAVILAAIEKRAHDVLKELIYGPK